jgi:hypothetical protein
MDTKFSKLETSPHTKYKSLRKIFKVLKDGRKKEDT